MTPQPRKRFGQHWLTDEAILSQIMAASALSPTARVLEIGPGQGVLTAQLLAAGAGVVAVEIDRDLCQLLRQRFHNNRHLLLIEGDILTLDLEAALVDQPAFQGIDRVVANIPYNITGPILEKLLGTIAQPVISRWISIVLLVQREVADRLVASPGSRIYGALSVRVQYLAQCEWICEVPAKAFSPPPKVTSAVIRLKPRSLTYPAHDPRHLEALLKAGFATRRKMLRNNLRSWVDRDHLTTLLTQMNLNPQVRAEDLSLDQWITLSNALVSSRNELYI